MPDEIPDWVTETPAAEAIEFHVLRCGTAEHGMQFVKMTRDEFIALKRHLAAMRGYDAPTVAEADHGSSDDIVDAEYGLLASG